MLGSRMNLTVNNLAIDWQHNNGSNMIEKRRKEED